MILRALVVATGGLVCLSSNTNFEFLTEVQPVRHSKFNIRYSPCLWIQLFHSAGNARYHFPN